MKQLGSAIRAVLMAGLITASSLSFTATSHAAAQAETLGPNIVNNGGFERGADPGQMLDLMPGTPYLAGWNTLSDQVRVIGTYWQAQEGTRSLSLRNPRSTSPNAIQKPGAVAQTLTTTPGQKYRVVLYQGANPFDHRPSILRVAIGGTTRDFTYQSDNKASRKAMEWVKRTFIYAATSASTRLVLTAQFTMSNNPLGVDNVQVRAIQGASSNPSQASPTATQPSAAQTPTPTSASATPRAQTSGGSSTASSGGTDYSSYNGTAGFRRSSLSLRGGRYVVAVLVHTQPGQVVCSFGAYLNGIEHPLTHGQSVLDPGVPIEGSIPYDYVPTLQLQAGHYNLEVSPISDCSWSITIVGGGVGHPVIHVHSMLLYHTVNGTIYTTKSLAVGEVGTFGMKYSAWGDGSKGPKGTATLCRGGKLVRTYTLRDVIAPDGYTALIIGLMFDNTYPLGAYSIRFDLSLGKAHATRTLPFTLTSA
jgi:FlaG/FlaF family flagellin (archaellin)